MQFSHNPECCVVCSVRGALVTWWSVCEKGVWECIMEGCDAIEIYCVCIYILYRHTQRAKKNKFTVCVSEW